MIKSIILALMLTAAAAVAQDAQPQRPPRQGPPVVQCENMKKLMKAVQEHRTSCESCKTNLPPRGQFGPGPRNGQGQRRGPGGPPQK